MKLDVDRARRARRYAAGLLATGLAVVSALSSCSGQEPPKSRAPASGTAGSSAAQLGAEPHLPSPASASASSRDAGPADAGPADAGASDPNAQLQERARAAAQCQQPQSVLLDVPDGGVVFNNAMTRADAGFIDRTRGVLDALLGQSQQVRCCFDAAAGDGSEAHAMLVVTLDPKGGVTEAHVDERRSTKLPKLIRSCIEQVAQAARYPASPKDKITVVEYLFKAQQPRHKPGEAHAP